MNFNYFVFPSYHYVLKSNAKVCSAHACRLKWMGFSTLWTNFICFMHLLSMSTCRNVKEVKVKRNIKCSNIFLKIIFYRLQGIFIAARQDKIAFFALSLSLLAQSILFFCIHFLSWRFSLLYRPKYRFGVGLKILW